MLALMLMLTGLLIKDVKFSALKKREMESDSYCSLCQATVLFSSQPENWVE